MFCKACLHQVIRLASVSYNFTVSTNAYFKTISYTATIQRHGRSKDQSLFKFSWGHQENDMSLNSLLSTSRLYSCHLKKMAKHEMIMITINEISYLQIYFQVQLFLLLENPNFSFEWCEISVNLCIFLRVS